MKIKKQKLYEEIQQSIARSKLSTHDIVGTLEDIKFYHLDNAKRRVK